MITEKEEFISQMQEAGDLEAETALLKNEVETPRMTIDTPLFTVFCC